MRPRILAFEAAIVAGRLFNAQLASWPAAMRILSTLRVDIARGKRQPFRSRSRVLAVPGWREAEPPAKGNGKGQIGEGLGAAGEDEARGEGDAGGDLSRLRQGLASRCTGVKAEARQTKPPARYTEASLLAAMEHAGRLVEDEDLAEVMKEHGFGTPATRAAVIETLVRREYARREKRALLPTPKGETLIGLAPAELRDVATTGEWEARLRQIEAGQADAGVFLGSSLFGGGERRRRSPVRDPELQLAGE